MKRPSFYILLLCILHTPLLAFGKKESTTQSEMKTSHKKAAALRVLPYAQVTGGLPGGGIAVRGRYSRFGIQLDGMRTLLEKVSFTTLSVAPLLYLSNHSEDREGGGYYLGAGIGAVVNRSSVLPGYSEYYVGFLGYEGDSLFIEGALNTVRLEVFDSNPRLIFPGLKTGFCF